MRIWSIHPKYLDAKGLVALWRETLLAKHVLEGKTKGYKNHPQLDRFKSSDNGLMAINYYLQEVWSEASKRGYNFDKRKFEACDNIIRIDVTYGQVYFEVQHLLQKLKVRDRILYERFMTVNNFDLHPLFKGVDGDVEEWERVKE